MCDQQREIIKEARKWVYGGGLTVHVCDPVKDRPIIGLLDLCDKLVGDLDVAVLDRDAAEEEREFLAGNVARLEAENTKLRAMLPKTADGVTPVDIVYRETRTHRRVVPLRVEVDARAINTDGGYVNFEVESCYSTKQAARAAAEGETK